jgi:hypothetical protein
MRAGDAAEQRIFFQLVAPLWVQRVGPQAEEIGILLVEQVEILLEQLHPVGDARRTLAAVRSRGMAPAIAAERQLVVQTLAHLIQMRMRAVRVLAGEVVMRQQHKPQVHRQLLSREVEVVRKPEAMSVRLTVVERQLTARPCTDL